MNKLSFVFKENLHYEMERYEIGCHEQALGRY